MRWLKVEDAAAEWCGGVSAKTVYRAIKDGRLRAARIGAGRNLLLCESWCDEWLTASAKSPDQVAQLEDAAQRPVVLRRRTSR